MSVAIAVVGGLVLGWAAARSLTSTLRHQTLERTNYRDHVLPTAGGLALVLTVIAAAAIVAIVEVAGLDIEASTNAGLGLVLVATLGFGLLGFVDDILGVGESGGFRGHLAALARGKLTSGGIKLVGGAALSVALLSNYGSPSVGRLLVDAAVIALAANLANLFDRAPGRTIKVALLAFGVLVIAVGAEPSLTGVALVIGASVALLFGDLRERVMMGDVGSNVLGAALGVGVVMTASPLGRNLTLLVLLALNALSEVVSFSKIIERVPPLRFLDRLGRPPL
ncbi:MAG: hypothetical protein ABI239_05405 [Aquihabitans sp.]